MRTRFVLLLIGLLALPLAASAGPIPSVVAVGDSLSDSGNAFAATGGAYPPSPPYAMRASNGPVAVEYLAGLLGLPLSPALLGGTNFAVVGATTGLGNSVGLPPTTGMLAQAAAVALLAPLNPDALFVVWGGPNDFALSPTPATSVSAVANLQTIIGTLYGLGARNFLVPNMPDLAITPFAAALTPTEQAGLHALSLAFNANLAAMLGGLALPGSTIRAFDTFALLNEIVANPTAFGLANVSAPCLQGLSVCAQPDTYLFWDVLHPTTAAHQILGQAFANAVRPVPEPATLALLGAGLAAVLRRRRVR